jgi:hypothetical protein
MNSDSPRFGVTGQTSDRRVGKPNSARGCRGPEPIRDPWIDRAHVDDDAAGSHAREDTIPSSHDIVHDRGVRQHGKHDIAPLGEISYVSCHLGPELSQLLRRLAADIVNDQTRPFTAQVRGHGTTHLSQADEADQIHCDVGDGKNERRAASRDANGARLE